jgi:Fe-S-cluster containining protein
MNRKEPQAIPKGLRPSPSPSPPPKNTETDILDTFEFRCNRCGRCCGLVPFTRVDYKRIRRKAEQLHIPFAKQIIEGHTVYLVRCIVDKVKRAGSIERVDPKDIVCPFLEQMDGKSSCKIYDDRPMICRMFGTEGWRGVSLCCPYQNIGKPQGKQDA